MPKRYLITDAGLMQNVFLSYVRHLQHGFLISTTETIPHQSANAAYAGHVSTSCAGVPQCEEWAATSPCARPSTRQSVQGWILNPEPSFLKGAHMQNLSGLA